MSHFRYLTNDDKAAIEARVGALEKATGVEIVTVVTGKSDTYPETVWTAFALGASFAALAVMIADVLRPDWITSATVLASIVTILGVGAASALACIYLPWFARWFLRDARASVEVAQYAKMQFMERELFATPSRAAILVLVSMLERRVVLLADRGLRPHVTAAQWDGVVARMTARLADGATGAAVQVGLDAIGALLDGKAFPPRHGNAFADRPIEEEGP